MKLSLIVGLATLMTWSGFAADANAQRWNPEVKIQPDAADVDSKDPIDLFDTSEWTLNTIRLRAFDRVPNTQDGWVDVTAGSVWHVVHPANGVVLQPGWVFVPDGGDVYVRVTTPRGEEKVIMIRQREPSSALSAPPPRPAPNVPAYTQAEIGVGINGVLKILRDMGLETTEWELANEGADTMDASEVDAALANNAFGDNNWLRWYEGDNEDTDDGITTWPDDGEHKKIDTRFTTYKNPDVMIVFQPNLAKDLATRNYLTPGGGFNLAVSTALHELTHEIIHRHKIKFREKWTDRNGNGERDAGEVKTEVEQEEEWVHAFEDILKLMREIYINITTEPRDEALDRRLRNLLTLLEAKLLALRNIDQDAHDKLFELFKIKDADGNGRPDFIDEWLRERGIDPATLPGPVGGGSGGEE